MEIELRKILFEFALLFSSITIISLLFRKLRFPIVLAPVLLGFFAQYTPLAAHLQSEEFRTALGVLSNFGVLFLLFYIGIQLDLRRFKKLGRPILKLTAFSILFSFLFGFTFIWLMGYGIFLAIIIGMTRIPVAEAVVVPILQEFKLLRTKIGQFIVGPGILDDIVELLLIAIVSIWVTNYFGVSTPISPLFLLGMAILFFITTWVCYRWLIAFFGKLVDTKPYITMIYCITILLLFASFAKVSNLGLVVGALAAGIAVKPWLDSHNHDFSTKLIEMIEVIAYGFTGIFFFFEVGLLVNLEGILVHPIFILILFLCGTLGKLLASLLMVPSKDLTFKEAIAVGIGLDVQMTTELIVAKILFAVGAIEATLYTALISASSLSMILVPVSLSILLKGHKRSSLKQNPK